MNFIFIWPLKHAGLALSIGLGACLNATLLYLQLRKRGFYAPQPGWGPYLLKLAIAVYAMALVLWLCTDSAAAWIAATAATRVGQLSWVIAAGGGTYFLALWLLGFRVRDFAK
jgi:putative peptidoglycan lipid II flippase